MFALGLTIFLLSGDVETDRHALQTREEGLARQFEAQVHIAALPLWLVYAAIGEHGVRRAAKVVPANP